MIEKMLWMLYTVSRFLGNWTSTLYIIKYVDYFVFFKVTSDMVPMGQMVHQVRGLYIKPNSNPKIVVVIIIE